MGITSGRVFSVDFTVVRALTSYGKSCAASVDEFEPYDKIQREDLSAREALKHIIDRAKRIKQSAFVFVNNRLEGNAPGTIDAITR